MAVDSAGVAFIKMTNICPACALRTDAVVQCATAVILEICDRIGASPRKLNHCFRDVLGVSPARYLRAVRLNNAQRELKDPGTAANSVQDVAARWDVAPGPVLGRLQAALRRIALADLAGARARGSARSPSVSAAARRAV